MDICNEFYKKTLNNICLFFSFFTDEELYLSLKKHFKNFDIIHIKKSAEIITNLNPAIKATIALNGRFVVIIFAATTSKMPTPCGAKIARNPTPHENKYTPIISSHAETTRLPRKDDTKKRKDADANDQKRAMIRTPLI